MLYEVAAPRRTEQLRIHDYVAAAVGLIAAVVGVTTIVVALFEAILPSGIAGTAPGNTLVLAITAVLVGAPLWWIFWSRTERLGTEERRSPSRRGYVLGLLGTSAIAAAVSLAVLLFDFLEDTLDGLLGADTFRDIRIELALVITLGAVAWYHFTIWRRDREEETVTAPAPRRQLLVVGPSNAALSEALARVGSVTNLERTDDVAVGDLDVDRVVQEIEELDSEHVLVLIGTGGVGVIPYRRVRT